MDLMFLIDSMELVLPRLAYYQVLDWCLSVIAFVRHDGS